MEKLIQFFLYPDEPLSMKKFKDQKKLTANQLLLNYSQGVKSCQELDRAVI
jgi:hypothetical protein